jgi:hypothetical protein
MNSFRLCVHTITIGCRSRSPPPPKHRRRGRKRQLPNAQPREAQSQHLCFKSLKSGASGRTKAAIVVLEEYDPGRHTLVQTSRTTGRHRSTQRRDVCESPSTSPPPPPRRPWESYSYSYLQAPSEAEGLPHPPVARATDGGEESPVAR